VHLWPAGHRPEGVFYPQALGITSILVQTALQMGLILFVVRRWRLPFGSLTVVFTVNAALMSVLEGWYGLAVLGLASGLIGDALIQWWQPSGDNPLRFRLFACAVPIVLYGLYFAILAVTAGVWWSIPFWSGAITLAGITGWLLSFLLVPPMTEARK
jgi:hypothetical protein